MQGWSLSEMRVASTGGKLGVQAVSSATAVLLLMRHQATHLLALPLPPSRTLSLPLPLVLIFIFIQVFSLSLLELDTELSWAPPVAALASTFSFSVPSLFGGM